MSDMVSPPLYKMTIIPFLATPAPKLWYKLNKMASMWGKHSMINLFFGGAFLTIATQLFYFVVPWVVFSITHSTELTGATMAVDFAIRTIVGIAGGPVADRGNSKRIWRIAMGMMIIAVIMLMILPVPWVVVAVALFAGAGTMVYLSERVFLARGFSGVAWRKANFAFQQRIWIGRLFGSSAGGLLLLLGHGDWMEASVVSVLIVVGYFFLSRAYAQLDGDVGGRLIAREPYFRDLWAGLRIIFSHRLLISFTVVALLINLAMGVNSVYYVIHAIKDLHLSSSSAGAYGVCSGCGILAGIQLTRRTPLNQKTIAFSVIILVCGMVLIGEIWSLWSYLTGAFLLGAGTGFYNAASAVIRGALVSEDAHARAFGNAIAIGQLTVPLGLMGGTVIGGAFGTRALYFALAALLGLATIFTLTFNEKERSRGNFISESNPTR